jgi:murein DD-endopeptidase MepM/ murein hydrolase activator NlpD
VRVWRVLALGVVVALLPAPAGASNTARIGQLQDQIGEMSRAEATARATWAQVHARRAALDADLARFDARIGAAEARAAQASRDAARLGTTAARLEATARRTQLQLFAARRRFDQSAVALYASGDESVIAYSAVTVDASSVNDAAAGAVYLQHVSDANRRALVHLGALRRRNTVLQRAAAQEQARVETARVAAQREQTQLKGLRVQRGSKRAAIVKQEARERVALDRIRAERSRDQAELAALQQTSKQIRAIIYDIQVGERRASSFHAARPVPGAITSPFGTRFDPVLHEWRTHTGVDFHAPYGAPIHAAAPGRIIWAGPRGGYGNCVVIDHGGQFATLYAHASAIYVNVGDRVTTGQTIAAIGATGWATGPHLHFEVRILGAPVNPVPYLD